MQVWCDLAIEHRVDLFSASTGFEGAAEPRDQQPDRLCLGGCEIGEVWRVSPGNEHEVSKVAGSLVLPMVGVDQLILIDSASHQFAVVALDIAEETALHD